MRCTGAAAIARSRRSTMSPTLTTGSRRDCKHRRTDWAAGIGAMLLLMPALTYGQCPDPHYRWSAKTDGTLASIPAVRAYVTSILRRWSLLDFTGEAKYECAKREGRELQVYSVRAW